MSPSAPKSSKKLIRLFNAQHTTATVVYLSVCLLPVYCQRKKFMQQNERTCTCTLHQQVDRWLNVRFATLDYRTKAVNDNRIRVQCVFQEYLDSAEAFFLLFLCQSLNPWISLLCNPYGMSNKCSLFILITCTSGFETRSWLWSY